MLHGCSGLAQRTRRFMELPAVLSFPPRPACLLFSCHMPSGRRPSQPCQGPWLPGRRLSGPECTVGNQSSQTRVGTTGRVRNQIYLLLCRECAVWPWASPFPSLGLIRQEEPFTERPLAEFLKRSRRQQPQIPSRTPSFSTRSREGGTRGGWGDAARWSGRSAGLAPCSSKLESLWEGSIWSIPPHTPCPLRRSLPFLPRPPAIQLAASFSGPQPGPACPPSAHARRALAPPRPLPRAPR